MTSKADPLHLAAAALLAIAFSGTLVHAEKNRNGALIVHTNDTVIYSAGAAYCGDAFDDPGACEDAGTRSDLLPDQPAVVWVLGSFLEQTNPAVTVVYFGIDHSPSGVEFADWSFCGPQGSFEIPDDGWPVTGLGNSVAFGSPIAGDLLFPIYWFAASGAAGAHLATSVNPLGGYAAFVDDSDPPQLDPITRFGLMRWQAEGANDCEGGQLGGCCLEDGHCEEITRTDCWTFAGIFLGHGAACDPNPCDQPPQACCFDSGICTFVPEDSCTANGGTPQGPRTRCDQIACRAPRLGACCAEDLSCRVSGEAECAALGGLFRAGVACEPLPCVTVISQTTWGRLKATFR